MLGFEDMELQPHRARRRLHSCTWPRHLRIGRVDQHGQCRSPGTTRAAAPAASPPTRASRTLTPVQVAARPGEARDQTELDRIATDNEHDRDRRGRGLSRERRRRAASAAITLTRRTRSAASAGSRSIWPSAQRYSIATFSALDVAGFLQALAERRHEVR